MQKIALLYDASQAVLSTFNLDEVLEQILSIVRDYFHATNSAVLLLDLGTREFVVRTSIGRPVEGAKRRIAPGMGLIGTAAQQKRPVYAPDVSQDSRYIAHLSETKSEVAIPLMVRDEVVGVLDIQSDEFDAFDSETLDLLTLFSTQASIALENARLYTLEQRRSRQLEAINAIARQTTALLDLDELLGKVCDLVLQTFPVDHVVVLLLDGEGRLSTRAHKGKLTPILTQGTLLPVGTGMGIRALEQSKTVVENEVTFVPQYTASFVETRSEMCVPLIFFGEKLGVLMLESAKPNNFPDEDVAPLESVADICAGAIQNAHYFEKAQQLAYIDGLTGIYNRRYFEKEIGSEIERASRYNGHLAIIMIDIDNFKRLNDELGHSVGDVALKSLAAVVSKSLRPTDKVARYGGEEFVMLLPDTPVDEGQQILTRLQRSLSGGLFMHEQKQIFVTFSAGVTTYREGERIEDALERADQALYEAKRTGKNRTCVA